MAVTARQARSQADLRKLTRPSPNRAQVAERTLWVTELLNLGDPLLLGMPMLDAQGGVECTLDRVCFVGATLPTSSMDVDIDGAAPTRKAAQYLLRSRSEALSLHMQNDLR